MLHNRWYWWPMETIKRGFGFILLATAWWVLSPVLSDSVFMGGLGALAILVGAIDYPATAANAAGLPVVGRVGAASTPAVSPMA